MDTLTQRLQEFNAAIHLYALRYERIFNVDLEDLLQEGRLAVVLAHRHYRDLGHKPSSYFILVIQRRLLRYARGHYQSVHIPGPTISRKVESLDQTEDDGAENHLRRHLSTPETVRKTAEESDFAKFLQSRIQQLPPVEQTIIQAHYFDGKGFPEIAQLLHVTPDAVRKRAAAIRRKLRALLKDEPQARINPETIKTIPRQPAGRPGGRPSRYITLRGMPQKTLEQRRAYRRTYMQKWRALGRDTWHNAQAQFHRDNRLDRLSTKP